MILLMAPKTKVDRLFFITSARLYQFGCLKCKLISTAHVLTIYSMINL